MSLPEDWFDRFNAFINSLVEVRIEPVNHFVQLFDVGLNTTRLHLDKPDTLLG